MTRFHGFRFLAVATMAFAFVVLECQCTQNNKSLRDITELKQFASSGWLCQGNCTLGPYPFSGLYLCPTYFLGSDPTTDLWVPYLVYCSPRANYDYYGRKCKEPCGFQGYSYQWCWTEDDSWGYCGTTTLATKVDRPLTIYGETCPDPCETVGVGGAVCDKGSILSSRHCSPYDGYTTMGAKCTNECAQQGYDYYWCYTLGGSWDYCAPHDSMTSMNTI